MKHLKVIVMSVVVIAAQLAAYHSVAQKRSPMAAKSSQLFNQKIASK